MQEDLQKKLKVAIVATGDEQLVSQFSNLTQLWDIQRMTIESVITQVTAEREKTFQILENVTSTEVFNVTADAVYL
jgi:molybdopterin biosynthesis enzyme